MTQSRIPTMTDSAGVNEPNVTITVTVNGTSVIEMVPTRLSAVDFIRHRLGLTGTHVGCEQGVCGMCTIILDGVAVKSCLMFAAQLDGRSIETVESLGEPGKLDALQEAFKDRHSLQCGFCTPAFLMVGSVLARRGEPLSRDEIREELAGVLCRCTGYEFIIDAVEQRLKEGSSAGSV